MPEHVHDDDGCDAHGAPVALGDADEQQGSKPMHFVSLHHHSTFSYLDGFQMPETHMERAAELEMSAMALTEHGNVSSHVKLEMAAEKTGVKPIYGVELYTGGVGEKGTQSKNHLTVLAAEPEGYSNLLRCVTQSYDEFYYKPTASWQNLVDHKEGLIVLSGCTGSLLATSLVGGKTVEPEDASLERGLAVARKFKKVFGDAYYLEVQAFPELENVCQINPMMVEIGRRLDIPLVATGDVHYTRPSESDMQMILHNVRGGGKKSLEDMAQEWGYDVPLSPPLSDRAIAKRLMATGLTKNQAIAAVMATEEISQRCTVSLPKLPPLQFPLPPGYGTSLDLWRDWLKEGWKFRNFEASLSPSERRRYMKQLKYEMRIIEDKNFIDYFLVVSDLVKFAKDARIPVGPARGSSAASLVCYLLRITEVNPMLYPSMVFERFIEPTRADLPDIDLDFDSSRRHEIRSYAEAKYGVKQVANIGTFTYYKSKLALDDVARVHKIPQFEVDNIKNLLLERSSGDLRSSATIEDTVEMFEVAKAVVTKYPALAKAMDLEGQIKQFGVHAAGLVISSGPIEDVVGVYARMVGGRRIDVVAVDKTDAERQNILKIDVLGLSTMTMISNALQTLGMHPQELYDLPLDDPKVIKGFQDNDVVGIFQFDGRAMRSVNAELQPDNFKEICDVNALARPGPLHNNASAEYIDTKRGRKEPRRYHPLADEITKDTHYQIVYQEQIMRICGEIGGFDHTHRTTIRKIIAHKHGEQEFNRWKSRFMDGASSRGVDPESAEAIWGAMITAGSYAFNLAHCVAYGMLAYWTMWLKVYHPEEFYAASLNAYGDKKQLQLLRDADRHGIKITPPDPNVSRTGWTAIDGALVAGLEQVPGIGPTMGPRIIEWIEGQKEGIDWDGIIAIKGVGKKTIEKIKKFCALEDPFDVHKLHNTLEEVRTALREGRLWYHDGWRKVRLPRPTHTSVQVPYSRGQDTQVVWVGVVKHRNLRELFEVNFSRTGVALDPAEVKNPELNEWVIAIGEDEEELLSITFGRFKYPKFKEAIWGIKLNEDVVIVRGVKKGYQSRRAIYAGELYVISMDDDESEEEDWEATAI